tara:strand:- start:95 stop:211 length:117 start_codon:yes stop_codon:yes gene_type:complete
MLNTLEFYKNQKPIKLSPKDERETKRLIFKKIKDKKPN